MNPLMGNGFYRLNTLLALLGSEGSVYSIRELSELLDVSKNMIYDDLVMIMQDSAGNVSICVDGEDVEDFEWSEDFESRLRSGIYDHVGLFAKMPFQSDIQLVLTDREWSALSDFLRDREYELTGQSTGILIKNSVSAVSERDLVLRDKLRSMIEDETNILMDYEGKDLSVQQFVIRPIEILHNISDNMIYLVAVGADEEGLPRFSFYRFDRIRRIAATKESAPEMDVSEMMQRLEYAWGADLGDPVHVKLRIYDEIGVPERIRRELGLRAEEHLRKEGEFYIYEDEVIGINKFATWVRSYGASIVVIEPKELQERMIRSAKERLEYYTNSHWNR